MAMSRCLFLTLCVSLVQGDLQYSLVEETAKNTLYANIKADSGLSQQYDDATLDQLSFVFLSVNDERDFFDLDRESGTLQNNQPIDRDELCPNLEVCEIELLIAVQPPEYFQQIKVTITLIDINDNVPKFPELHIVKNLSEAVSTGVLFPIQAAVDPDGPDYGISRYKLQPSTSSTNKFSLQVAKNADGSFDLELVLDSALDREIQDFYQLQVLAYDRGEPANSGSIIIDIVVEDVNDNQPEFDSSGYDITLPEDYPANWTVVTVHATDADKDLNGELVYSFSSKTQQQFGHLFKIHPKSGEIRLKSPLDYETYRSITLIVMAQDRGEMSVPVQVLVLITIEDINDNAPIITLNNADHKMGEATVAIPEHIGINKFVAHISVRDPDGGGKGNVKCTLDDRNFRLQDIVEGEYTVVTTQDIDREIEDNRVALNFVPSIECVDEGPKRLKSVFNLTVIILDINDHTPRFTQSVYNVSIKEGNQPTEFVTRVLAYDPDSGKNGEVVYIIQDDLSSRFMINPSNGIITATKTFDREEVDHYEFRVKAQDRGEEVKGSEAQVSVWILDTDDEPPRFDERTYTFQVYENLPMNHEVGNVNAKDLDLPGHNEFFYNINEVHTFFIESTTGTIFTRRSLDREQRKVYNLTVRAISEHDSDMYDAVEVIILVLDRNDNYPEILYPSEGNDTVQVSNNVPRGHIVATVDARDRDCELNCHFTYSIDQGVRNGEFRIHPRTGEIEVNTDLHNRGDTLYRLVIKVSDNGDPKLESARALRIQITEEDPGVGPSPEASVAGLKISSTQLAIIVGVVLGCLLIAVILVIAIVVIRRRNKMAVTKPPAEGQLYWPRTDLVVASTESTSPTDSEKSGNIIDPSAITLQAEDTVAAKLAELAEREAVKAGSYNKPKLAVLHPPPVHAPRSLCSDSGKDSGRDTDSGYVETPQLGSSTDDSNPLYDKVVTVAVKCNNPNNHHTLPNPSASPRKLESFSDWLHSESYHLKQEGHSYHVADPNNLKNNMVPNGRKSVRFNTLDNKKHNESLSSESDVDFPAPPDSLQILNDSKYPPYNSKLGSLV